MISECGCAELPPLPTAQASLALTTVIAASEPVPVSALGLVTRDQLVPFQCTSSTLPDSVWPTAQALPSDAAPTPFSWPAVL